MNKDCCLIDFYWIIKTSYEFDDGSSITNWIVINNLLDII